MLSVTLVSAFGAFEVLVGISECYLILAVGIGKEAEQQHMILQN